MKNAAAQFVAWILGSISAFVAFHLLSAFMRNPKGQDAMVWLVLGALASFAALVTARPFILRRAIKPRSFLLHSLVALALLLPVAALLGAFFVSPP
jgi:hypothetical protein